MPITDEVIAYQCINNVVLTNMSLGAIIRIEYRFLYHEC